MKSTEEKPLPDHELTDHECAEADARGANVGAIVAIGRFGFVRAARHTKLPDVTEGDEPKGAA